MMEAGESLLPYGDGAIVNTLGKGNYSQSGNTVWKGDGHLK